MPLTSHPFSATTSSNSEDTEAISPYSNYVFLAKLAPELAKKRLIFIGDVHGNLAALNALLEKVEYEQERDHVIFTGDLIAKGNKSIDVVKRVRELGASCVIGNHDDKLIRWKAYFKSLEMRGLQYDSANVPEGLKVGSQHELIAREFDDELYEYLLKSPLVLDISEHNIYVVHAGLVPDVPITEQTPFDIMNMRNIDKDGTPTKKKKKGQPWIDSWNAAQSKASTPKIVIYGHNASEGLTVRPYTIGLDSGCGSGRTLTAMIWNEDRKIVSVSCASVENL